jgi:hypothetical protein
MMLLPLLFLKIFRIFLQAFFQVGSRRIENLLILNEYLDSSLPSLMSMVPTWFPDGVDSYPPFNMPSPPKDYRMIIKAKRCLPSNRLPPPTSYPDYEQTSFDSSRGDDVAATPTHQKKSRNFSGNTTDPYALNNYASQVAQNILDRVKQELCKIILNKIYFLFFIIYCSLFR